VVLIAGGAKNLGGLIARDLAQHGAKAVAIHYNSAATRPTPRPPWRPCRRRARRPWPCRRT
jgi:NAD(P)-dependent dehydrogenase (short-subunit alcohol dehydrogenase family)